MRASTAPTRIRQAALEVGKLADELELGDAAPLLRRMEEARRVVSDAIDALERTCRAEMNAARLSYYRDPEATLPALLASRTGTTTRTEGAMLTSAIAARVADEAVDRETGEVLPIGVLCERVAMAVAEAGGLLAPSAKWRKTGVRKRVLRYEDYVDEFGGRETVRWDEGRG